MAREIADKQRFLRERMPEVIDEQLAALEEH
jgi:hypothetical protein